MIGVMPQSRASCPGYIESIKGEELRAGEKQIAIVIEKQN
jgi:hypothetical protein